MWLCPAALRLRGPTVRVAGWLACWRFCRPGKAQPPPGKNTPQERHNSVAGIRRHAQLSGILPAGAMFSRFRVKFPGVAEMTEESPP